MGQDINITSEKVNFKTIRLKKHIYTHLKLPLLQTISIAPSGMFS